MGIVIPDTLKSDSSKNWINKCPEFSYNSDYDTILNSELIAVWLGGIAQTSAQKRTHKTKTTP